MSMFAGFRSRWTMPTWCATVMPVQMSMPNRSARFSSMRLLVDDLAAERVRREVLHRDGVVALDVQEVVDADDVLVRDLARVAQLVDEALHHLFVRATRSGSGTSGSAARRRPCPPSAARCRTRRGRSDRCTCSGPRSRRPASASRCRASRPLRPASRPAAIDALRHQQRALLFGRWRHRRRGRLRWTNGGRWRC